MGSYDATEDPAPADRVFYYHTRTGDRGYLVERDGKEFIRYDRPGEEILRKFGDRDWKIDKDYRPLTKGNLAQIAFEADKKLCFFLGEHDHGKKEWLDLKDNERIDYVENGPTSSPEIRGELFDAIYDALKILSE